MLVEKLSNKKGDFKVVTTPTVPGYKITKVIGLANGLSPRTRGVGGVIVGIRSTITPPSSSPGGDKRRR